MMELQYIFYINATPEQVWHTLVSPEGTRSTFFGAALNTTLEPGAEFKYVGPGNDGEETVHVYGTILEAVPSEVLSYLEHPGASYRENHTELESRVTFTLETIGSCTKLTLTNDQWTPEHPAYANAKAHWWMILSSIKTYTETGKTLDLAGNNEREHFDRINAVLSLIIQNKIAPLSCLTEQRGYFQYRML